MASGPKRHRGDPQLTLADSSASGGFAPEEAALEGTLGRVVYQNPTSQWTVARLLLDSDDTADEVTVVGQLHDVYEGMPLRLWGDWEDNSQYGRQFRVRACHPRLPETLVGLERYLGSKQFPGVGAELAKRIVAHFGQETRAVLDSSPGRLIEVEGIGRSRVKMIAQAWGEHRDRREVKIFLHSYGVSDTYAERIFKRYGRDAVTLIRQNPYRLALEIWGIGFRTADRIARNLGLESTAPERLEAGLIHALGEMGEDGNLHAPEPELLAVAAKLLEVDEALLPGALESLEKSHLVVREVLGDRGPCTSLTRLWSHETVAAARLTELLKTPMRPIKADIPAVIDTFENAIGISLATEQRRAIEAAILDKCVVITGGPGVGKTTIVRAIVSILAAQERDFALAAPTGRAAKRLGESTGFEAVTVHRLLEFQPNIFAFQRNEDNPLEVDAVIVDEVSMVDIALFRSLLAAMPASAQLVLVGDIDQLPSVGPGAVLADVIASGAATVVRLTEIFRQAAESRIIVAAHEVNRGQLPSLKPPPGQDASRSDFYFISREEPEKARDTLVKLVAENIPKSFGFSPERDIQVLCPMHRGVLGTLALNDALQTRLNPAGDHGEGIRRGERFFRVRDKVMQIKNNYDKSVFNGDIGVIQDIVDDGAKIVVDFNDGRTVTYKRDNLDQLIHAYAVSVHKSQGSEYPAVVLPLVTQHYMMLQRNLLYTAITRGKKLVVIIGQKRAVRMATDNDDTRKRWTWLAERIRAGMQLGEEDF